MDDDMVRQYLETANFPDIVPMDDRTRSALKKAYEALVQVEFIEHTNWTRRTPSYGEGDDCFVFVEACAWCHKEGGHSANCPRQIALAAIEEIEL